MKKVIALGASFFPLLAFAQGNTNFNSIQSSIGSAAAIVDRLIPFVIGLGLLLFLVGVLRYITAGADEESKVAARGMMIFGIIALFVMTAVWGFVKILGNTVFGGGNTESAPTVPHVPTIP